MIGSRVIFTIGLFVIPVVLLWWGHALRRRTPLQRAAFWGASLGYCAGMLIMAVTTLLPPVHWSGGASLRVLAVHWSLLLATVLGGLWGALRGRS